MALETGIYYLDGEVIAQSGNVKIYQDEYDTYLEIGPAHNMWALESELNDYKKQINNKPKGNCLEIGLGLGVASRYILSCKNVVSLTTVEKNKDVINVYCQIKQEFDKRLNFQHTEKNHIIINSDGMSHIKKHDMKYDYIFMDFYSIINEDTLPEISDMFWECRSVVKYKGIIDGWLDKYTPTIFLTEFNKIFKYNYVEL